MLCSLVAEFDGKGNFPRFLVVYPVSHVVNVQYGSSQQSQPDGRQPRFEIETVYM